MNTALRLIPLLNHFSTTNPKQSMLKAWQAYFGGEGVCDADEVVALSALVIKEIKSLESVLSRMGVPHPAYGNAFHVLKAAWSPTQLSAGWASFQDGATRAGVMSVLHWAAWAIQEKNDIEIDDNLLNALIDKIETQEDILRNDEIPTVLREMLQRHVSELREAVKFYKICGIQAVADTVRKQMGEMATTPKEIINLKETSESSRAAFKQGVEIIVEAGKVAESGSKFFKFASEIKKIGGDTIDTIVAMIQNNPTPPGN